MQPTKCFALLVRITMAQHLPLIIVWDLHDCKQMRVGWHYCVHCSAEQMCFENRVHYISIKLHKVQMWRNESIYVSVKDKAITEKKKKKFNVKTNSSRQESLGHTALSQEDLLC